MPPNNPAKLSRMVSTWPLRVTEIALAGSGRSCWITWSIAAAAEARSRPWTSASTSNTGRILSWEVIIGSVPRLIVLMFISSCGCAMPVLAVTGRRARSFSLSIA